MTEERVHHPYSPSTLQNLEACPSYRGRESDTPHERTTAGTRAHGVVDTGEDDTKLGDDDAVHAADCLDFVARRQTLMEEARQRAVDELATTLWGTRLPEGAELDAQKNAEGATPVIIELKEIYLPVDDIDTTAGYVDRALIDHTRERAELFDWKFGMWAVEKADNNLQGIAYSLGLFHKYPSLKTIQFWFKQPTLDLVTEAIFTREMIPALYLRVQTVVARAREARQREDFATANPVVPACNFCSNLGVCPKVAAFACKIGSKFFPLEMPADVTPTMIMAPAETKLAMRLSQIMAVWSGAFRANVTDRVLRGAAEMPAGYTLQSRSNREVVAPEKFKSLALGFLTQKEYDDITPVPGFGAVEECIKDRAPRGQKKLAIETFQKSLEESGAVVRSQPYSFLRAVSEDK